MKRIISLGLAALILLGTLTGHTRQLEVPLQVVLVRMTMKLVENLIL